MAVTFKTEYYEDKKCICVVPYDSENGARDYTEPVIPLETSIINQYKVKDAASRFGASNSRNVSTGTLQRIIETAESYLNHQNDLVYAHKWGNKQVEGKDYGNSAFVLDSPIEVLTNQYNRTGKACNCTTFAFLVMMGCSYENSRYVLTNTKNKIGSSGYCFNPYLEEITIQNYETYYNTKRMWYRFKELGMGTAINKDYSNVGVGDIVFFSTDISEHNIGHVGVVLATAMPYEEGNATKPVLLIAECTSAPNCIQFNYYTSKDLIDKNIHWVGKPQYQYIPEMESEVLVKLNKSTSSLRVEKDFNLNNTEILTFEFDYTPTATNQYVTLKGKCSLNDTWLSPTVSNRLTEITSNLTLNQTHHIVFTTPFHLMKVTDADGNDITKPCELYSIDGLGVYVANNANQEHIKGLKIYRGLPGREKDKIESVESVEDVKTKLLSLIPTKSNQNIQGHEQFVLIPTATFKGYFNVPENDDDVKGDEIQFNNTLECNMVVDWRITSDNSQRLIASWISGTVRNTLVYTGTNWRSYAESLIKG